MKEHLIDRQLWRKHMTKKMRTIVQKLIAASLSVSLVVGLAGCSGSSASQNTNQTASAESGQSTDMNAAGSATNTTAQEVVFHPPVDTPTVIPEEKEETVYVQADAAGRPTKKTVEVALKKIRGEDPVEDRSNLREIKNTEGDEEYSEAGQGRYLWENHGEEIRYKGESDQPLPVDVAITYFLEGSQVTADEIAGKTGAVRIRFDYDNHTDVPFMVLSSAILSGDVFSDIEVTNGRILDLGDRKAVIGFAFPGLMDSLKLADYEPTEEIDLPEYVEIEARAVDFALDFTATVVSTGLFDELEDEDLQDLEDMADDMDELTDASSELADAAGELADGGATFGEYLDQYFGGLSKVSEGTGALDKGLSLLGQNIGKLTKGAGKLEKGLGRIEQSLDQIDLSSLSSEESEEASAAAQEALQTLAQSGGDLSEKLGGISASVEGLQDLFANLQDYVEKTETLKTAVDENPAPDIAGRSTDLTQAFNEAASSQAREAAQEAAQNAAENAVSEAAERAANATAADAKDAAEQSVRASDALDGLGLTDEQIDAVKSQLIEEIHREITPVTGETPQITVDTDEISISLNDLLSETLEGIQAELDTQYGNIKGASDAVPDMEMPDLSALSPDQLQELAQTMEQMQGALGVIGEYAQGLSTVQDSLTQLSEGMDQLRGGVKALSQGSQGLTEGLQQFETAVGTASDGASQLNTALSQVSSAGGKLGSAYWELVDGMNAFADGVSEFDEEGIQSLAELTGPEYMEVIRRVKAARDAEHSYNNFSGILDGQKGSVRFVIETEKIEADD